MRILSVNCGSSSLKFALFEGERGEPLHERLSGSVAPIGLEAARRLRWDSGEEEAQVEAPDHAAAAQAMLDRLSELGTGMPDAVAHRVVHGGVEFREPVVLEEATLEAIADAARLAPLHNEPALAAVRALREALPNVPHVASFDTAFHRSMPPRASRYAISRELTERHGLWRFGFHGLAHRYMAERAAVLLGRPLADLRLVTLQLGAGCSAAAIAADRSIDTSMGLTPLEGLMMATRSGDLDPSLPGILVERAGLSPAEAQRLLNARSGLLGVSGRSADIRVLLRAEQDGDAEAALAVEMFCYRVRKQVGAYLAALDGADAVVFGGGTGEHQPDVRQRICEGMEWAGIQVDTARNASASGEEMRVEAVASRLAILVVPVNEELVLARDALAVLFGSGS